MFPSTEPSPSQLHDFLSDLSVFAQLDPCEQNGEISFQVDIVPAESPRWVWFGFVLRSKSELTAEDGFVIRLDLESGEVYDAMHGTGLLEQLDPGPLGLGKHDEEEPLLLKLQVEKLGRNLLPSISIGDHRLLYPAIIAKEDTPFYAVAGTIQPGADAAPFCYYPAAWVSEYSTATSKR